MTLRSLLPAFEEVLSPYPAHRITEAFKEWLKTKSVMPTPADILGILNFEFIPKTNRPEYKILSDEENHPGYFDLPENEQREIDELVSKAKDILKPPEKKGERKPAEIGKHFHSMPVEAQKSVMQSCMESAKRGGF